MTVQMRPYVTVITGYNSRRDAPKNEISVCRVMKKGEDGFEVLCNIVYGEGVRNLSRPLAERGKLDLFLLAS